MVQDFITLVVNRFSTVKLIETTKFHFIWQISEEKIKM